MILHWHPIVNSTPAAATATAAATTVMRATDTARHLTSLVGALWYAMTFQRPLKGLLKTSGMTFKGFSNIV